MHYKKVSIVLPVYNGASNLSQSIESILAQTYNNWELIIVNDCSSDETKNIAEKYQQKDNRIRLINNIVNLKLPRSLNRGFEEAKGDYLTWTSDDNIFLPTAIERMVETFESQPDLSMVYTDYHKIDENGKIISENCAEELEWICCTNPIGACFMYTRDVAQKVGNYDPDLFLAEDYDFWIRIMKNGKVFFLKEILYLYRVHGGSLSSTRKDAIGMQTYRVIERHFVFLYDLAIKYKKKYLFFEVIEKRVGKQIPEEFISLRKRLLPFYSVYCSYEGCKNRIQIIKGKIRSKF